MVYGNLTHQPLTIPAMSVEAERIFSSAKRLVTSDRNRVNDETMETLQLLKYWWNNSLIEQNRRRWIIETIDPISLLGPTYSSSPWDSSTASRVGKLMLTMATGGTHPISRSLTLLMLWKT